MTGNYPPGVQAVIDRIPVNWGKEICCRPGWWNLISDLNEKLAAIDPLYVVHQCKEKFGSLRFYAEPSTPREFDFSEPFFATIRAAEAASLTTCEICGLRDPSVSTQHVAFGSALVVTLCPDCLEAVRNPTYSG